MAEIKKGTTNVTRYVMIVDSSDGSPETAVDVTTLDLQYTRYGAAPAAKVDATSLGATDAAWDDNEMYEVDSTSSPGLYRVDWPDAAFASGVEGVILVVSGTGFAPAVEDITLVDNVVGDALDGNDRVDVGIWLGTAVTLGNGAPDVNIASTDDIDLSATQKTSVNTEADNAIVSYNLDHLMKTAVASNADMTTEITDGSVLSNIMSKTSDTSTYAVADDSLEANRDHATTIKSETALIVADTGELQTDDVPGLIGALNNISTAEVNTEVDNALNTAIPGAPTADSINERVAAIDDLTQASGGGDLAAILGDTNELQTDDTPAAIAALNNVSTAEVNAEVDSALADIGLNHLLSASVTGTDIADNSIVARLASEAATADWDTYNNTTDSLEALRNRGDASWITGGGGGITDLLNVVPLIPESVDLANTATWRLGLMLTNALDDLPSTAEITPGTISIDRKASGGTTWTAIVSDGACSEIDGLIYYDEVFDTGTGYAVGDSLRITFKAQKITVSANDYEVSGATGRVFYTMIREDMRGTDSAALASVCTEARLAELAAANLPTDIDAILADTNELQTDDIPTVIGALNNVSTAEVNTEVDTALADVNLDHLVGTASGIPAIVAGTYIDQIMDDGTASYDRTSDSLQALRDRGDAAWVTGGGGSITDLLNVVPLIPESIDLANTATWRIGLMLFNTLDDLPSTAEITPGTISLDRKASGGTSWASIVSDGACSESAGLIYYDEVFDSGTGYAAGDSIRVTFKSQKITVSANDYEVSDATGRVFYTQIREDMRGTDSAALASQIASIEGSGFATGTDSLTQIRDAIDTLLAPSVVGASALSGSGFLSDCVTLVRQMTDEPTLVPKYTDADIVEHVTSAMTMVMSEIHTNSDHNLLCRFNIPLVSGQQTYIIPPNVGEIWRVAKMSTTTPTTVVYEAWPDNHWSSHQSGFVIEHNEFRLLTDWRSTDTLEVLYVPNGESYMHKATATSASAGSIVFPATVTDGTLDTRANAYAGYLCRLLSDTNGYVQERIISSYNNVSRTATLTTNWDPVPLGTIVYEVLPTYTNIIKHVVCMQAALDIFGNEGNAKRTKLQEVRYQVKMRALRQMIRKKSSRFGGHAIGDTADNDDRGDFFGWLV